MTNLPAMTDSQRQDLIADCNLDILKLTLLIEAREKQGINDIESKSALERQQISLAALTAEKRLTVSVVQKNERLKGFNFEGYESLPAGEHEFYTAPPAPVLKPIEPPTTNAIGWVRDTIRQHDEKWKDAIRKAGYEVK